MRALRLFLFVLVLTSMAGSAVAAGRSHIRDGWMYGLNLGWGWGQAQAKEIIGGVPEERKSDWADALTGGLRVGFAPDEQFAYGMDFSGWTDKAYYNSTGGHFDETVIWILVQGHWFPGGQGFFLRGAAGLGTVNLTYRGGATPVISKTQGGFAFGAGAGWEARVSDTFAIGIAYDYRQVNAGDAATDLQDLKTRVHAVTLNLNWYMD